jgi:hypothetical protein
MVHVPALFGSRKRESEAAEVGGGAGHGALHWNHESTNLRTGQQKEKYNARISRGKETVRFTRRNRWGALGPASEGGRHQNSGKKTACLRSKDAVLAEPEKPKVF